jgi:general secretion pathway protein G
MEPNTQTGRTRRSAGYTTSGGLGRRGYTLVELIIVMAIISVLVSIAVPLYQKSLIRTKETTCSPCAR